MDLKDMTRVLRRVLKRHERHPKPFKRHPNVNFQVNFLIACICHAPNKKCKHKNEDNPKFLSYRDWDSRVKNVEDGKKTSCGCWAGVSHGLILSEDRMDNLLARILYSAKSRAKEEKRPINIDPEYMKSLELPKYCPILGIIIDYYAKERHDGSPSLDKFYPKLGYVKGNIRIISWRANRIKSDGSPEEWEKIDEWCKKEDIRMRLEGNYPDQK